MAAVIGRDVESAITCPLPQVGQTIEYRENKFKILRQLWSGPFSDVFVILDALTNEQYAMKVEKDLGSRRSVLKLDVFVLREFQNKKGIGFPRLITSGQTSHLKFVILQLVGPDINKLRRCLPGWLSRDIKASNFTVGRTNDSGTIYMIDFGFARRFRDRKGNVYEPRSSAPLVGSIQYASMAAHAFRDQCRELPWASVDPLANYHLIGEWKRYARYGGKEELLTGVPSEFEHILDIIDSTRFDERPDYRTISRLIETVFSRLNKAGLIGDQGQSREISCNIQQGSAEDVINLSA
uniref:Protein kinase domain-containing protein n=1 Tax=Parascaris equorum TaxID=6256 RepID=A0A914RY59_PAREQ